MHCVSRGGCYLVNSCCDLQEDNQWKKESYEAWWVSLVLETRPQYKMTVTETDSVRRESYEQQQVVHFMVERTPGQTLVLGMDRGPMTKHQLPLARAGCHAVPRDGTPKPIILERRNDWSDTPGMTAADQELTKPVRENFRASSLMSSPRQISHRVQRRE